MDSVPNVSNDEFTLIIAQVSAGILEIATAWWGDRYWTIKRVGTSVVLNAKKEGE